MGFIAPLYLDDERFEVTRLDFQFWALTGPLGWKQRFFADVGLLLTAKDNAVDVVGLALPFAVDVGGLVDLRDHIGSKAAVIMGPGTKTDDGGRTATFAKPKAITCPFTHVALDQAPVLYKDAGISICRLRLNERLAAGQSSYIRARFRTGDPYRTITRKRSGLGQNGALIDLRVSDVLEIEDSAPLAQYRQNIVSIEWLQVMIVIRAALQLRVANPPPARLRLLERGIWESYATRKLFPRRAGAIAALIAYEFDSDAEADLRQRPVTPADPFTVFLDVSREFGLLPVGNFFRIAIIAVAAVAVTDRLAQFDWPSLASVTEQVWDFLSQETTVIVATLLGGLAAIGGVAKAVWKKWKSKRKATATPH